LLQDVYKIRFGFLALFHPRLALKLAKSADKGKIYFGKYSVWASKNAEFHADFNSVENVP
jgi:hypothetical protein